MITSNILGDFVLIFHFPPSNICSYPVSLIFDCAINGNFSPKGILFTQQIRLWANFDGLTVFGGASLTDTYDWRSFWQLSFSDCLLFSTKNIAQVQPVYRKVKDGKANNIIFKLALPATLFAWDHDNNIWYVYPTIY